MKYISSLILFLYPIILSATDSSPTDELVLRGIFDMGSKKMYSLSSPGGASSSWVKPGGKFLGFTVGDYNAETQTLSLEKDGQAYTVGLAGATTPQALPDDMETRLEEAQSIFKSMRFKETVGKVIDAQMTAIADMQRQQLAQSDSDLADDEEYLAFMDKAMRDMMNDMDWDSIQVGMEQIYAETFTQAELKGISEFYATPAGQATVEKTAEIQQKSMQVMMPAIIESSQKMTESLTAFMEERADREAAETATEE